MHIKYSAIFLDIRTTKDILVALEGKRRVNKRSITFDHLIFSYLLASCNITDIIRLLTSSSTKSK